MSESWSEDRASPVRVVHEWATAGAAVAVGFNKIMQSAGQYRGVSEPAPQFVLGRPLPHNIFGLSAHDHHVSMSLQSPAVGHGGAHVQVAPHQQQQQQPSQHHHALQHHSQQQQQQHHQLSVHPGSLQQSLNVGPAHQSPSPPASAVSYPPHPGQHSQQSHHQPAQVQVQAPQHQVPSQHQQQGSASHQQQQQQQNAHAQQSMVQQLGLGSGPDSPDAASPPIASRPSPASYNNKQMIPAQPAARDVDDEDIEDDGRGTLSGNRWPRQETLALIKIRSEMDANFRDSGLKGPLWEDVSRKLADLGYQRSAKKCKEKFENIHKYHKKTKDGKAGRQDGKSYRFFSELEALYSGRQQHGASSTAQAPRGVATDRAAGFNAAATTTFLAGAGNVVQTGARGLVDVGPQGSLVVAQRAAAAALERTAELSASGVTLTDSSEDDYDVLPAAAGLPGENHHDLSKKKRKRLDDGKLQRSNSSSKLMSLESLVKKLTHKQEAMQRQFLEAMERREQDRMVREEAFKRQEMARVTRDHELRAQEQALAASRDAALVAFLQKLTGQTLQLPEISPQETAVRSKPVQQATTPPPPPPPVPRSSAVDQALHHQQSNEADEEQAEFKDGSSVDPNCKRWPKPEVNDLIRLRSSMETRFQEAGTKAHQWEEISSDMSRLGYNRNAKRCKEKWENINKYFRKTKESNKKRPENAKTCPYFHQLDTLYRQGVLVTPTTKLGNKLAACGQTNEHDSGDDHELLDHDHRPITAILAAEHDINAAHHAQQSDDDDDDQAEILRMLPAPDAADHHQGVDTNRRVIARLSGTHNGSATVDQAVQFFSSPDNGSSADQAQNSKKSVRQQITPR